MILHVIELGDPGTREEVSMDSTDGRQREREEQRAHASRGELVERIARAVRADGTATPLEGLMLRRTRRPRAANWTDLRVRPRDRKKPDYQARQRGLEDRGRSPARTAAARCRSRQPQPPRRCGQ